MKFDMKCSKPWAEEFFGWLVCVKWPGVLEERRKIGQSVSLRDLIRKVYAKCLEKRCHEIIERKSKDNRCGFGLGRSTTDQIFTL